MDVRQWRWADAIFQISSWLIRLPPAQNVGAGPAGSAGITVPQGVTPRTLPMLAVKAEDASSRRFHGGRCAGILDPPGK